MMIHLKINHRVANPAYGTDVASIAPEVQTQANLAYWL